MKKIGILGATGYTGEELLRYLSRHPHVDLAFATSEHDAGKGLNELYPYLSRFTDKQLITGEQALNVSADLVFLCLPHGESARWGEKFFQRGAKIVDLGADFRFYDAQVYQHWYHQEHPCPGLLNETVYGLVEWNREKIRGRCVVGNPGCYPTATLLAALPFMAAGIVADGPILVDAKSGVSGAGKNPTRTTHYVEVNEGISAYKVGRSHRHVGEMEQELSRVRGSRQTMVFTPHLTPMSRGILAAVYLPLLDDVSSDDLQQILKAKYADEPFIRIFEKEQPSTRQTAHSNLCLLHVERVSGVRMALITSAIDNLGKGAAGQAIQNMNLMLGIEEGVGLL